MIYQLDPLEQNDIDLDLMIFDEMIESKQNWIGERIISLQDQQDLKRIISKVIEKSEELWENIQNKKEVIDNSGLPELYEELEDYITFRKNIQIKKFEEMLKEMNELNTQIKIENLAYKEWNRDYFIQQQEQISKFLEMCDKVQKYKNYEQDLIDIQNIEGILNLICQQVEKNYLTIQEQRGKYKPLEDISDKQALILYFNYLAQIFEYLEPNQHKIGFQHQLQFSQNQFAFYLIEQDDQFMSLIVKKQEEYLLYCKPNIRPTLIQQIEGLDNQMNIEEHVFLPKENQYKKIYETLMSQLVQIGLIEQQLELCFSNMQVNLKKFESYQRTRSILDCFEFLNQFGFTII